MTDQPKRKRGRPRKNAQKAPETSSESRTEKLMALLERLDEDKLERLLADTDDDLEDEDPTEKASEREARKEERIKSKARRRGANFPLGPRPNRFEEITKKRGFKTAFQKEEQEENSKIKELAKKIESRRKGE